MVGGGKKGGGKEGSEVRGDSLFSLEFGGGANDDRSLTGKTGNGRNESDPPGRDCSLV